MTYYVAKILSLYYLGDTAIMPTSFEEAEAAHEYAREHTFAKRNISTRINNQAWIESSYVVIKAKDEAAALKIATQHPVYIAIRKKVAVVYIED